MPHGSHQCVSVLRRPPEPRRGSPCRSRPGAAQLPSCWLISAPYDLSFIIGSAVLLFVPHGVHLLRPSNIVVDLVIAAAIGGPHLFATYTLTFMEPNFRRRHPRYAAGALLLLVLATAIASLDLLVTIGTTRTARPECVSSLRAAGR